MLVSAISASNTPIRALNVKGSDAGIDNTSNLNSSFKKANQEKDLASVYNSINEWKHFCYSQMDKGRFDIIA